MPGHWYEIYVLGNHRAQDRLAVVRSDEVIIRAADGMISFLPFLPRSTCTLFRTSIVRFTEQQ